ncbi:MAG: hypothetical protein OXC14_12885 [Rhodospirillaceae bacterium]|nr:hypothetical protein [Rhodospirillaceae bacterium]
MIGRLFYVALSFLIGWAVFDRPAVANAVWERMSLRVEQFVSVLAALAARLLSDTPVLIAPRL